MSFCSGLSTEGVVLTVRGVSSVLEHWGLLAESPSDSSAPSDVWTTPDVSVGGCPDVVHRR